MKFPRLMSMPEGLRTWLETELESLGIDSVVYSRYILSLLQHDVFDPHDYSVEDGWHVNLGDEKTATQGKRKSKRGVRDYMYCSFEQIKRNAAVQCLMSASEHNTKIESLVDQLCEKLKHLDSEGSAFGNSDPSDVISDSASPGDLVEKYYAAFPALCYNTYVANYRDGSHSSSLNESCQCDGSNSQTEYLNQPEAYPISPPTISYVEDQAVENEFLESVCQVTADDDDGWDCKIADLMPLPVCVEEISSPVSDNVVHPEYVEFASKFTDDLAAIWEKSQENQNAVFASKTICRPNFQVHPAEAEQQVTSRHIWSVFFDPVDASFQQSDISYMPDGNQLITSQMVTELEKELYNLLDNCNNSSKETRLIDSLDCGHYQQFRQVQPFNCSPANSEDINSNTFYIYHCTNFDDDNRYHNRNLQPSSFVKVTPRSKTRDPGIEINISKPIKKVEIKRINDFPDQSSSKNGEKLLISPRTHFRPIHQVKEGLLDSYEDGATFNISQSPDHVEFIRTADGDLCVQQDGKSPVFYQAYDVPKNPFSCLNSSAGKAAALTEDFFVPKFKIRTDLEKYCQTDDITPPFGNGVPGYPNPLEELGKPWSFYSDNGDPDDLSETFSFYKKWSSGISSFPVYETDDEDGKDILSDIEKYCSNIETGNFGYPDPEDESSMDAQDSYEAPSHVEDHKMSQYEHCVSVNGRKSDDFDEKEDPMYCAGMGDFLNIYGSFDPKPKGKKELTCGKENNFRRQAIRRPCTFHMEGKCRRADCKFLHDFSQITCRFWEEGACFKGETCPFLHGYPSFSEEHVDDEQTQFELYSENDFPALDPSSLK